MWDRTGLVESVTCFGLCRFAEEKGMSKNTIMFVRTAGFARIPHLNPSGLQLMGALDFRGL